MRKFRGMNIVGLDFETYYDTQYTLKKIDTPLYVNDDRFLIHGVGINEKYFAKESIAKAISSIDWSNTALLCHNTAFDAYILNQHFNIQPKYLLDTMSLARPYYQNLAGGSGLDVLAKYLGFEGKTSDILVKTKGKRELSTEEIHEMAHYCLQDIDQMFKIWDHMQTFNVPQFEYDLIDMTIRMFSRPLLEADLPRIRKEISRIERNRESMFTAVHELFPEALQHENTVEVLRSSVKFAKVLEHNGAEIPMKTSLTTGKETYAFAKTDLEFQILDSHPNPNVRLLRRARLTAKSDTAYNKAKKLELYAKCKKIPALFNYARAQTMRWSGAEIQLQNMNRGGEMRRSLIAPPKHQILVVDSGQIEARMTAWLAGQNDVLEVFRNKQDIYKVMATKIYGKELENITKHERFVGKCIGEGTLLITERGYVRIEHIKPSDKVWNGEKFICHQGLVKKGYKETVNLSGTLLTPDHLVLCENQWLQAQSILQDENIHSLALDTGAENLQLLDIYSQNALKDFPLYWSHAIVEQMNIQLTIIISKTSNLLDVMNVQNQHLIENDTGNTPQQCRMINTELDYLIDFRQQLVDAQTLITQCINIMEKEASQFIKNGLTIELNSLNTYKHYKDGITQNLKWIEQIMMKVTSPEILDLFQEATTCITNVTLQFYSEELKNWKKKTNVYDLLNCEEGNKFAILTNKGPIIAHNCAILGLGYGMSANKFQLILKQGALGPPVDLPASECKRVVDTYRRSNDKIKALWKRADGWLRVMSKLSDSPPIEYKGMTIGKERIITHKGASLVYPDIKQDEYNGNFSYQSVKGRKHIYGALLVENIVQHLARNLIAEQTLELNKVMPVVITVHDEAVAIVPSGTMAEYAYQHALKVFRTPAEWCSDIPLDADGGFAQNYSK